MLSVWIFMCACTGIESVLQWVTLLFPCILVHWHVFMSETELIMLDLKY